MRIFDSSKDYGTNSVLIHYDGKDNEFPDEEDVWDYMTKNHGEKGEIEEISPPNHDKFRYNCGSITVKCKRINNGCTIRQN